MPQIRTLWLTCPPSLGPEDDGAYRVNADLPAVNQLTVS